MVYTFEPVVAKSERLRATSWKVPGLIPRSVAKLLLRHAQTRHHFRYKLADLMHMLNKLSRFAGEQLPWGDAMMGMYSLNCYERDCYHRPEQRRCCMQQRFSLHLLWRLAMSTTQQPTDHCSTPSLQIEQFLSSNSHIFRPD